MPMSIVRLYVKVVCVMVAVIGGVNVAALLFGTQHPSHPALVGFTTGCAGQSQPCWYGIIPGVTTVDEAHQLIPWDQVDVQADFIESRYYLAMPDTTDICRVVLDAVNRVITWMTIEYCANTPIQIGDVVASLGLPARIVGADRQLGYGGVLTNNFG